MIAKCKFTGLIDGKWKTWNVGDKIDPADAKTLGLKYKPELAKQVIKK